MKMEIARFARMSRIALLTTAAAAIAVTAPPATGQVSIKQFEIPAQPLSSAILEFSRQSDVLVVATPELTAGRHSRMVKGPLPVAEAIADLLRGSGLRAVPNTGGGYRIESGSPSVTTSGGGGGGAAPAQDGGSNQDNGTGARPAQGDGIEDIVVTAQFKSQRIQDIPIAISAVSGASIESRGLQNIAQVAHTIPNVFVERSGAGTGVSANVYIRGVGQSDSSFSLEPGVGVYVDDVYYGVISGSLFETLDLDRVEILRGPQGTLAGKNSIGGAIKLFSRVPTGEPDAYVEAGYGSYQRINLRAATNLTIVPDTLFLRLSASAKRADGYLTRLDYGCATGTPSPVRQNLKSDCKIGTDGGQRLFTGRASLRWLVADGIENTLIADTIQDDSESPAAKLRIQSGAWGGPNNYLTGPRSYTSYADYISDPGLPDQFSLRPEATLHGWGVANRLSARLGDDLQLVSVTGYRVSDTYFPLDLDGSPADVLSQEWSLDHKQFTQELRLSGTLLDKALEWTVGGFYYDAKGRSIARFNVRGGYVLGGGGIDLLARTDDTIKTSSKSAFGQLVVHPFSRLSVTAALRYTKDHKDYLFHRYDNDGNIHPIIGNIDGLFGVFDGSRVDYRFAADYKIAGHTLIYAQTSSGFKGGGVNAYPYFKSQVVSFKPETLASYEAGFKTALFDRMVRLNGAVFHNNYRNLQGLLRTCPSITPGNAAGPCSAQSNIGNARVNGAELEGEVHSGGLSINGSVGYLDFKYTSLLPDTGVTKDMTNLYTPKWTASGGIEYGFAVARVGRITPRFDINYISSTYSELVNSPDTRIASRSIANAQLKWNNQDGDWEATIAVTNLFNTFKYLNYFQKDGDIYFAQSGQPTHPREWLLTVKRRF